MITFIHSAMCITTVGALMLPALSRKAKSVERMRTQVDDVLQHRANHLLRGPACDGVTDLDLWRKLDGWSGAWSMLQQARLMNGIVCECRKTGTVKQSDVDGLRDCLQDLKVNFRLAMLETLTARDGDPLRHYRALALSYAKMGDIFDRIVGEYDGQTVALMS